MALSKLSGVPASQIKDAGTGYIAAYHLDGTRLYWPPPEFSVADVYLKTGAGVSDVPELVRQGLMNLSALRLHSDQAIDGGNEEGADLGLRIEAARLLTEAGRQLGNPELARSSVAGLRSANPQNRYLRVALDRLRASFAELDGKKLDALLLYRSARSALTPDDVAGEQEIATAEDRLLRELGGSDTTRALWRASTADKNQPEAEAWVPVTARMSPWKLTDTHGKVWQSEFLKGKKVLINAWATWCIPCQQELPALEELYQKTKDRSDIAVITFDIDEEIGRVAPFTEQKHYSFPVLFAKDYVDTAVGQPRIPENWIVGADGKWLLQHSGFEPDPLWVEKMLKRLEHTSDSN